MLFSLRKIAALAANRQAYLRGIGLYGAGAVSAFTNHAEGGGDHMTAAVTDRATGGVYPVEIGLSADEAGTWFRCDCRSREQGACKHVVAALAYKYYHDMVQSLPADSEPPTSEAVRQMLEGYTEKAQAAIRAAAVPVRSSLIPALHLHSTPSLSFSVQAANGRVYVVRDVSRFAALLRTGSEDVYGTDTVVLHHPTAFDEKSRPLLALVEAAGDSTRRDMPLSPERLDLFFDLCTGQTVEVDGRPLLFKTGDPPITLTVTATDDGAVLSAPHPRFAVGVGRLYYAGEDALYGATTNASAALHGLLQALWDSGGSLPLSARELERFVGNVLPALEPYVTFEGDVSLFDPYRPRPMEAALYLDQPEPDTVTARLEFHYADQICLPGSDSDGVARDFLGEWRVQSVVSQEFPRRDETSGLLLRRGDDDSLFELLTDGLAALSRVATVYMSDAFRRIRITPPPRMAVGVRMSSGLLELDLDLGGLDRAELAALLDSYRRRKRYHRLKNGSFFSLSDPALLGLTRLSEGLGVSDRKLVSGRITVPAFRAPFVDKVLSESRALGYTRDDTARSLLKTIKMVEDSDFTPPDTLVGTLRGYQRAGFCWLRTMETLGFGGILADDMGLGKTVQMIALFLDAQKRGITLPSLVVCPASLVLNWESELHRFAPSLSVRTVIGDSLTREAILRRIAPGDIVITSYDLLKRDLDLYAAHEFHYHVLDEAQYIKNHNTQNARAVKAIRSRQRFALSGTPVENRLSELWSVFDFLMPGFLFSYPRFRERYEQPAVRDGDREALTTLSRMCAPFLLRRLKADVLRELPPKTETVRFVPLEDVQQKTYLAAALNMRQELAAQPTGEHTRLQTLTMLTRLRQICCDPSLCFENYRGGSAKLDACVELAREAVEGGHRVLLFSQFTSMLAILEKRLRQEGIAYFLLQGSTPKEQRAAMVESFNRGEGAPVFLISLKAGGTGLNLTAADVVIHYDPWWNLSVQNQATDRAHRIGQRKAVQVYKFIAQGTVEEKILRLQESKQSLADAVVRADTSSLSELSDEELLSLLL